MHLRHYAVCNEIKVGAIISWILNVKLMVVCCSPRWTCTVEKTSSDLWWQGWDFSGGVGGCSRLELINLISAGLMAGFIFFLPLVLFHLVKQSPYRALSACGESAYLHEPAEWSPLPQEWSPDKDDPQGHWLQACLPLDSGNPALAAATAINNGPATPTDISLSLALPSTEQWTNKDRPNGVFLTVPGQKAGLPRIKAW